MEVYVDDMLVKSKTSEQHIADLTEAFGVLLLGFTPFRLRHYKMKLNPTKCAFGISSGKFLGFMVNQRGIEANPNKIKVILVKELPKNLKKL